MKAPVYEQQIEIRCGHSNKIHRLGYNETYTENNIFFNHDLPHLLASIINDNHNIRDTDTEKEIAAGTNQEIPFEFTIPIDVSPSYKGKNASITYIIKDHSR